MVNIGLTFRNSKWSDYSRSNLGQNLLDSFKTLTLASLLAALVMILIFYFAKYALSTDVVDNITAQVWFSADSVLYTKVSALSVWTALTKFFSDHVVQQFWLEFRSIVGGEEDRQAHFNYMAKKHYKKSRERRLSGQRESRFSARFASPVRVLEAFMGVVADFAWQLHKGVYKFLGLPAPVHPATALMLDVMKRYHTMLGVQPKAYRHIDAVVGSYPFAQAASNMANWGSKSQPNGMFVLPSDSFTSVSSADSKLPELDGLSESMSSELEATKHHRWVYKYTTMHRNAVQAAHTNTLTKNLLNSGYYDTEFFTKNVNSTSLSALLLNPSSFFNSSFYDSYANFVSSPSPLSNSLTHSQRWLNVDHSSQLSAFEQSYYWALLRSFLFGSLPSVTRVTQLPSPLSQVESRSSGHYTEADLGRSLTAARYVSNRYSALGQLSSDLSDFTSNQNNLASTTAPSALFDYDFTETMIHILSNQSRSSREAYYYSTLFSDTPNGDFNPDIKGLK